jgi:hypothetical protein
MVVDVRVLQPMTAVNGLLKQTLNSVVLIINTPISQKQNQDVTVA